MTDDGTEDEFDDEEDDEDEDEDTELLLQMGDDGVLHQYKPKPGVLFDFDTEDALYEFMNTLAKMGIVKQGDRCQVKNVSTDFFNRFEPIDLG